MNFFQHSHSQLLDTRKGYSEDGRFRRNLHNNILSRPFPSVPHPMLFQLCLHVSFSVEEPVIRSPGKARIFMKHAVIMPGESTPMPRHSSRRLGNVNVAFSRLIIQMYTRVGKEYGAQYQLLENAPQSIQQLISAGIFIRAVDI